jgi:hypothetical protein
MFMKYFFILSNTSLNFEIQDLYMYLFLHVIYIHHYTTLKIFIVVLYNISYG